MMYSEGNTVVIFSKGKLRAKNDNADTAIKAIETIYTQSKRFTWSSDVVSGAKRIYSIAKKTSDSRVRSCAIDRIGQLANRLIWSSDVVTLTNYISDLT